MKEPIEHVDVLCHVDLRDAVIHSHICQCVILFIVVMSCHARVVHSKLFAVSKPKLVKIDVTRPSSQSIQKAIEASRLATGPGARG